MCVSMYICTYAYWGKQSIKYCHYQKLIEIVKTCLDGWEKVSDCSWFLFSTLSFNSEEKSKKNIEKVCLLLLCTYPAAASFLDPFCFDYIERAAGRSFAGICRFHRLLSPLLYQRSFCLVERTVWNYSLWQNTDTITNSSLRTSQWMSPCVFLLHGKNLR